MKEFKNILETNPNVRYILKNLEFPYNLDWFLVGGSINQTIWNYLTNRDWFYGINDYDIHYWDNDLSEEKEQLIKNEVDNQLSRLKIKVEVINQARVHLWFKEFFKVKGIPFTSLKEAMTTHPFTVMCIGINNNKIYAPYGIKDTLSMVLRYNNKTHIPMNHVLKKMNKWIKKWPELKVIESSF